MVEYDDDGMALIEEDPKFQEIGNTYSLPMEYKNGLVSEDVLLNCPHCHKTFVYTTTSRFPTTTMCDNDKPSSAVNHNLGFFNFNRSSSANNANYNNTLEQLFPFPFTGGGGGSWNRKCRWCSGFLVILLTTFLIFSFLLQSQSDKTHRLTPSGRGIEEIEDGSQIKIKRLPQCIIIGARKCGTRALIDMLNLHPQVRAW